MSRLTPASGSSEVIRPETVYRAGRPGATSARKGEDTTLASAALASSIVV
ncbi:MAG: hypothetical protein ACYDDZ_10870 [Acidimicrobiales bacterium]